MRSNQPIIADEEVQFAASLSHGQYSGLGADARKQIESFTGWNYLGIVPIAKMAARSIPMIYDDRVSEDEREHRRQMRTLRQLGQLKSFAESDTYGEPASPEFRWWKLLREPNPWQTGRSMRWELIQSLHIHGMAIVWNVKNQLGTKTVWRIALPMTLIQPLPPGYRHNMPTGGLRVESLQWISRFYPQYAMTEAGRLNRIHGREISLEECTIYSYPHPVLRGDGFSPSTAGERWIDMLSKSETAQEGQYDFGPRQKVLIKMPNEEGTTAADVDAYQKRLDRRLRDSKSGVVAAAFDQVTPITLDADEMGYKSTADTLGPATMALHGTPGVAAGLAEGMTYGSVAASLGQFIAMTVQPDLDLLADADTQQMVSEEGPAFTAEYDAPTVSDPELDLQQDSNEITAKAMTVGEWRQKQGRPLYGDDRDDMTIGSPALDTWKPTPAAMPTAAKSFRVGFEPQAKSLVKAEAAPEKPFVVAVDLDGTLAQNHFEFNESTIEDPRTDVVEVIRVLKGAGCGIVIYTCRDSDSMVAAWLEDNGVPWDAINRNPWAPETDAKMMADLYLDDRAVSALSGAGTILEAVARFAGDEWADRIRKASKAMWFDRRQSFLFVPILRELKAKIEKLRSAIPEEHLGRSGYGLEPHITVLYGILDTENYEVAETLRIARRPQFDLRDTLTVFDGEEESAVVLEVSADDLAALNDLCVSAFPHVASKFPVYRPHITLAYVKPEYADQYANKPTGLGRIAAVADRVIFRDPKREDSVIPLK